jgi:hypothetical protein
MVMNLMNSVMIVVGQIERCTHREKEHLNLLEASALRIQRWIRRKTNRSSIISVVKTVTRLSKIRRSD